MQWFVCRRRQSRIWGGHSWPDAMKVDPDPGAVLGPGQMPVSKGLASASHQMNEGTEHHMEIITKALGESDDKITAWSFSSE